MRIRESINGGSTSHEFIPIRDRKSISTFSKNYSLDDFDNDRTADNVIMLR